MNSITKQIETQARAFLNESARVEVQEFGIDDTYYQKHELWDEIKENWEDLSFAYDEIFLYDLVSYMDSLNKKEFKNFVKRLNDLHDLDAQIDDVNHNAIIELFNEGELDEELAYDIFEYNTFDDYDMYLRDSLPYWTIYFEPMHFDIDTALKCGLIPFTYGDLELLALGGCGMDLSPKLDAYQSFKDNTLPSDSKIIRGVEDSYFAYVVGKQTTKEVIESARLEKPIVHISYVLEDFKDIKLIKVSHSNWHNFHLKMSEEEKSKSLNMYEGVKNVSKTHLVIEAKPQLLEWLKESKIKYLRVRK